MCGIAGLLYFDIQKTVDIQNLKRMTDVIHHRGPDDEGHYINNNIGLGFRRLSIIDLTSGHQPLSNSNGTIWITFNGEIYNFKELREQLIRKNYKFRTSSDTEVIIYLYEEYGEECLKYLRGMFGFVIWDERKKQLFGARDRFGIKPFYYYSDKDKFVWGSELKVITACKDINRSISLEALDDYFSYGYVSGDKSIFNSIHKLEPATYFIIKPFETNSITFQRYWDINFEPDFSKSEEYWMEQINEVLSETVKMHMISDVPLGGFLSGGIDSSSVVALMAKSSSIPVKTFSIGFKEKKYDELVFAREVAKKYETQHHEQIIEPDSISLISKIVNSYDEPFADSSAIPTYYVSKFAREFVTVSLSGDGGDELFAGYDAYSKLYKIFRKNSGSAKFNNIFWGSINKILPETIFGKGLSYYLSKDKRYLGAYYCFWKNYERKNLYNREILANLNGIYAENNRIDLIKKSNAKDFVSKLQEMDIRRYMVDNILTKVDRVSMQNSLEVRVPLLDHVFAELTFKIPVELKLNRLDRKYIFKRAMSKYLPDNVLKHKKQGFAIPLSVWFKKELHEHVQDKLSANNNKLKDYFDVNYIAQVIENHKVGQRDFSSHIWSLLIFEEWLNQNQ